MTRTPRHARRHAQRACPCPGPLSHPTHVKLAHRIETSSRNSHGNRSQNYAGRCEVLWGSNRCMRGGSQLSEHGARSAHTLMMTESRDMPGSPTDLRDIAQSSAVAGSLGALLSTLVEEEERTDDPHHDGSPAASTVATGGVAAAEGSPCSVEPAATSAVRIGTLRRPP